MILDVTCGYRAMWYQKHDPDTIYLDKRKLPLFKMPNGRTWEVWPTIQADNRCLPFPDNMFDLVLFDPPHLMRGNQPKFDLIVKYGFYKPFSWQKNVYQTIRECFRVLKPKGFLIFKWNDTQKTLRQLLTLFPQQPLFGSHIRSDVRKNRTWFLVFKKEEFN